MARYNLNDDQIVQGFHQGLKAMKAYDDYKAAGLDEVLAREMASVVAGRGVSMDAMDRLLYARERVYR